MIIGYTTGVFDMFHIGHLNILRQAKIHCDYLIVGVSTDALVESYKKKKPIISEGERLEIVSCIKYVDKVVFQKTRDKLQAYHEHGFDIMFVGDDWKGNDLFQNVELELNKFGASVMYFQYTQNISSTKLSEVIRRLEHDL